MHAYLPCHAIPMLHLHLRSLHSLQAAHATLSCHNSRRRLKGHSCMTQTQPPLDSCLSPLSLALCLVLSCRVVSTLVVS
ncbi:hypothetical protein BCV69DRAFT_204485 [Microstroma glucosiphilum]|uniref:Uncharacterized protein n=1 Tax=Pseudomicrostroma glucosiphilum TaxID=1684307 RepID=A0A316U601_9BASI|nr:hypothetical protein BCV69DRAFT_204485 [Pseudomicrostroma glucosiphilum]PWN20264.1 hypothetical protein BCV69DRAFT_204485 [Pseudomicrostroma glucosiphilum]